MMKKILAALTALVAISTVCSAQTILRLDGDDFIQSTFFSGTNGISNANAIFNAMSGTGAGKFLPATRMLGTGTLTVNADGSINVTSLNVSGTAIGAGGKTILVNKTAQATNTRTGLSKYDQTRPFSTIGAALTAAASGDTIWVQPGTYTEAVTAKDGVNIRLDGTISIDGQQALLMGINVNSRIYGSGRVENTDDYAGYGVRIMGDGVKSLDIDSVRGRVGIVWGYAQAAVKVREVLSPTYDAVIIEPGARGALILTERAHGFDNGLEVADNGFTADAAIMDASVDLDVYGTISCDPGENYGSRGAINLSDAGPEPHITINGAARGHNAPAIGTTMSGSGVVFIGTAYSDAQETIKGEGGLEIYGAVIPPEKRMAAVHGAGDARANANLYEVTNPNIMGVTRAYVFASSDGSYQVALRKYADDGRWELTVSGDPSSTYVSTQDVWNPWEINSWSSSDPGPAPSYISQDGVETVQGVDLSGAYSVDGSMEDFTRTAVWDSGEGVIGIPTNPGVTEAYLYPGSNDGADGDITIYVTGKGSGGASVSNSNRTNYWQASQDYLVAFFGDTEVLSYGGGNWQFRTGIIVEGGMELSGSITSNGTLSFDGGQIYSNGDGSMQANTLFVSTLFDISTSSTVLNLSTRELLDSSEQTAVEIQNRTLRSAGSAVLDWAQMRMSDSGEQLSLSWVDRETYRTNGSMSVDWEESFLQDAGSIPSIAWNDRQLYNAGGTLTLDWNNRQLLDGDGTDALNWDERAFHARWAQSTSSQNLTADNVALTVASNVVVLSSNDGTAGNRTFTLPTVVAGTVVTLVWNSANAGELVDTGSCKLSSTWTPTQDDTITLVYVASTWYEIGRSTN